MYLCNIVKLGDHISACMAFLNLRIKAIRSVAIIVVAWQIDGSSQLASQMLSSQAHFLKIFNGLASSPTAAVGRLEQ